MGLMSSTHSLVLAPFAEKDWAYYWLSAPDECRKGQKLYLDLMALRFPEIASLPSKYSFGANSRAGGELRKTKLRLQNQLYAKFPKSFSRPIAMLNYIDYANAFRFREDYRGLVETAFNVLTSRQAVPWLDLNAIRANHLAYKGNYEKALLILIGLAVNLEVQHISRTSRPQNAGVM